MAKRKLVHLDTHVVCWLYAGLIHQLSATARVYIEQNDVAISPWVLAEMQELYEKNILNLPAIDVFDDLTLRMGLSIAEGDALSVVKASFPLCWANDNFDRMIAAHARLNEVPLLSKDAHFHTHFKQVVW